MTCRVTEYQRQQWRLQQEQRREQSAREQQRVDSLKNQWAQYTAARPHDLLAAHQRAVYYHKAEKLIALNRIINGGD